jgi:hypothetical protein
MSAEVVHVSLKEKDRKAVADLLQSLAEDMTALRTLNVGENEPASLYGAVEVEP